MGESFDNTFRLNRDIFFDDALLAREYARVFFPTWQLVGFSDEIPEAGDYVVRRLGADSVVVVRDERGRIAVLLNSCGHRGTRLCQAAFGNAAHFRCSYHGWTYANDGRLVGVPGLRTHYPPGFRKSERDLPTARVVCRRGFLFATWDPDAPDLEDYLGDLAWYLDALLDGAGGEWEVYGPPQRVVARGNWKIPVDNFAGDGYHMRTAHQIALEQGIYGDTLADGTRGRGRFDLLGVNIGTEQGHSVRAGYVVEKGTETLGPLRGEPAYPGYPPETWPRLTAGQTPEQVRFNSDLEVVHGAVFPNAVFLSVAHDRAIGEDDDPLTRYLVWRVHSPIDARRTECTYWTLVPKAMDADWKRRSYSYQARTQSAGGILFEMDDFENFARIDSAMPGTAAGAVAADLSLGLGLGEPAPEFPGPGRAEYLTLSEHNQRAFYRRWAHLMEVEADG
ncbi:aromatic ring-hydroxylating oxygenase subunit alpha [Saccharothrix obliqua]|uniref:aromatic ring-hydroxylating oxygenase subunit alpha n=1 Tax=Saccharothrix obliqua TaxID=2861747 RepID=UPI001C5D9A6A|nr:Rieske 2Fe-2S domain-containing protein [Saccharothrix obliqua]MBW4718801.1 Rieske 2Fe-2S domain-containing protein [Saccharothrix obliqua]